MTASSLATAVLPMAVANAAPSASAALGAAATNVFPTAKQDFTVTVSNSGLRLVGETINYVDIKLPSSAGIKTAGDAAAPSGWTPSTTSVGGIQTYTFRGGSIAPGGSLSFTFPGSVAAPTADRAATFEVAVSSDNGRTTSGATGALTTTIRTLQVLTGSIKATAPTGVVDQTGTAGQSISYAFDVKNHARSAQTVTPTLSSNSGSDTITQAGAGEILAGATRTFTSSVTLGGTANRTATFTAAAAADPSQAAPQAGSFAVQAAPVLSLDPASFAPSAIRSGITKTFSVSATKNNTPGLTLTSGRMEIPGTSLELPNDSAPLNGTPSFAASTSNAVLSFGPDAVVGPDELYDARFTFGGTDDNGFGFAQTLSLSDVLTLDSLGPVIDPFTVTLPNDAYGHRQTAVSNEGDAVSVAGTLSPADCNAPSLTVTLQPNTGTAFPVDVTRNGCDFSGTFTTGEDGSFANGTSSFKVTATAVDAAGNAGSAAVNNVPVDLVAPVLTGARTVSATENSSSADRILVTFTEGSDLYGGCRESQWRIDGELFVADVLNGDGATCTDKAPTNTRLLVLTQPRDQDLQTNVTYAPGVYPFADPVVDGAGQTALEKTIATVVGVVPAAPSILTVERGNGAGGREAATFDEDKYWTNLGGSDLTVGFGNGRAGYRIEVLDGAGRVLTSKAVAGEEDVVAVPLGATDAQLARSLRLVNADGLASQLTSITVVLDRVRPTLGPVSQTGARTVDVNFSEKLATGTDFAEDWFVFENNNNQNPDDPDDDRAYYQVGSVTGTGAVRTLTTNGDLQGLGTVGADYLIRNPDAVRYEDRAGNTLANTV